MNDAQLFQDCIDTWGTTSQILMAIEELNELGVVLCHSLRANKPFDLDSITEEITDVQLMIDQLVHLFGLTDIQLFKIRQGKIDRLRELLEDESKFRDGAL